MHPFKSRNNLKILGFLALIIWATFFMAACKGKEKAETPATENTALQAEDISLDTISAVLGKPEAEKSGIFDLGKSENELQIVYHFYTPEAKDIDDDIGLDLAPKIQELYKKFKTIDRVAFAVYVFHAGLSAEWKPYCTFVMTRKVINETNWTDLLATEFFKVVLELKYAE
jgi:hypothetical protein